VENDDNPIQKHQKVKSKNIEPCYLEKYKILLGILIKVNLLFHKIDTSDRVTGNF